MECDECIELSWDEPSSRCKNTHFVFQIELCLDIFGKVSSVLILLIHFSAVWLKTDKRSYGGCIFCTQKIISLCENYAQSCMEWQPLICA